MADHFSAWVRAVAAGCDEAGSQRGFQGEHSVLFREVLRLAGELEVEELLLENVAAITSPGLRVSTLARHLSRLWLGKFLALSDNV